MKIDTTINVKRVIVERFPFWNFPPEKKLVKYLQ